MIPITQRGVLKIVPPAIILFFSSFLNPSAEQKKDVTGLHVPDGFTIERAVDPSLLSYPMFASFDGSGRLFVFESTGTNNMGTAEMLKNPTYHIRLLEDTDGDGIFDKSGIFADHIPLPMGGSFYRGSLYVAESPDLVRYTDTDGDGKADTREVILTGWVLNSNAATLSGPFVGPDGWLYMPDARRGFDITTKEGRHLKGKGARIWRCRPDGTRLESMSGGGFDNAIEIAFMPSGETIGTMTYFVNPQGGYRDALMHWVEGGVYPKPQAVIQEDKLKLTGPLMPVMSKTARVAPSGLMRLKGDLWGKEYNGNLFSAEFNTGRIMRHVVTAQGASYTTADTPFMTSSMTDSHPTDVLQDADGSMLVVVTGGWFIEGCPLSRVAKPEVAGGIYRIRKKGSPVLSDAWGKKIDWARQTPTQLDALLNDKRPAVRTRAAEALIREGNKAIPLFKKQIQSAPGQEMKLEALFALSRIETPEALASVRSYLLSKQPALRTAAARVLGLSKDSKSTDMLMKIVATDLPQVRRQAATALGQIGDARAVPALLKAAESVNDRFAEHAIIYSLIQLGESGPLVKALSGTPDKTRKVAFVALDQMDQPVLKKEHLLPFLESGNQELRAAGIWVATHRPEWTDAVVSFLDKELESTPGSDGDLIALRDLMVTFCKSEQLQDFLTRQLKSSKISSERKLLLLSVIGKCDARVLPATWVAQLGELLSSTSPEVLSEVLNLIQSRRMTGLDRELSSIVGDRNAPAGLRVRALAAKLVSDPIVKDSDFTFASSLLSKSHEAPLRQAAANLLIQATLSENQLVQIAQLLPDADQFLLPALTEVFAGSKSEKAGMSLVKGLGSSSDRLTNISEQDLLRILSGYPQRVKEAAETVIGTLRKQNAERLEKLTKLEKELPEGDVLEGRKLFFGKGACSACHAVSSEGGDFGPDLTNIGDIRSRHDILEAILYPSASFAREHESTTVVTKEGTYLGIIREQTADHIVIAPGPGAGIRISRNEITSMEQHNVSMMPPGLDELLTKKELADLVSFLEALPDGIRQQR